MTEDQENKKLDYKERHRFWAGHTLEQFGTANNFFLISGIALLGYLMKEFEKLGLFNFGIENIDYYATALFFSICSIFLSILFGALTLLSRLYDLRLTRHINTIRIIAYSKEYDYKTFKDEYIDIEKNRKICKMFFILTWKFIGTLTSRNYFITNNNISEETIDNKFLELRKRALMLGRYSWISFNFQILWLLISLIFFVIKWIL